MCAEMEQNICMVEVKTRILLPLQGERLKLPGLGCYFVLRSHKVAYYK